MKLNLFKLFILLAFPFATASAADVNMKFGKPTKEEMQMTTYEADPNADAVVLCRLTDVEYTVEVNGYLVDYHEKVRIKVLKPGGERFARVVVPFSKDVDSGNRVGGSKFSLKAGVFVMGSTTSQVFEEAGGSLMDNAVGSYTDESVEDLKAVAFNQDGSKIVKAQLKKSDVRTTKLDDTEYQLEFTVPGVKVGTVIEYEYIPKRRFRCRRHESIPGKLCERVESILSQPLLRFCHCREIQAVKNARTVMDKENRHSGIPIHINKCPVLL